MKSFKQFNENLIEGEEFDLKSKDVDHHLKAMNYHAKMATKMSKAKNEPERIKHAKLYHKHKDIIPTIGEISMKYRD